jgi:UBX domain-containing protein 1
MRYDEPGNKDLLEAIQSGRAPPSLFNVRFDQELEISVQQRTGENYQAPPKISKPFEGSGNRLGSAAPEISGSGSSTPAAPSQGGSGQQGSAGQSTPSTFEVDTSKPTTSIQLRLGDGSK